MTDIDELTTIASILTDAPQVTWAYAEVSADREDPRGLAESRERSARDFLKAAGAPEATAALVAEELVAPPDAPAPVSRYLLAVDGTIVLSEVLPGEARLPESLGHGPCPDILPLLVHRPLDVTFIVVEVGRDGGGFRVFDLGRTGGGDVQRVQGRTDTLHKIRGGGWNHLRYQHHTEELWRQNAAEVASALVEASRRTAPRLIAVAGDISARQLLIDELPHELRDVVTVVDVDPRASDASEQALTEQVEIALARILATRIHDAVDVVRTHFERGDGRAVARRGELVTALAAAQVDTLLIDPAAMPDQELFVLKGAPWVASAPEEALGVEILGRAPAVPALVRAALLTDARIVVAASGSLPGTSGAAALLRWPVGPAAP